MTAWRGRSLRCTRCWTATPSSGWRLGAFRPSRSGAALAGFNTMLAAAADVFADACFDALCAASSRGSWSCYAELAPTALPLRNPRPASRWARVPTLVRRMKALLLENIHPEGVRLLTERGVAVDTVKGALDEVELIAALAACSLLGIRSKTTVTRTVLDAAPDLLAIGAFCIGTNQIDLARGRGAGHRGLQRAVLQHPQRGRAGARRDHLAGPAPDRQERGHARRRLGQVGQGRARGARPDARHRRLRQHRQPAVGGRGVAGHARLLLRRRGQAGAGQRPALRQPRRAARGGRDRHPARRRAAGNAGLFGEEQFAKMRPRSLFLNLCRGIVVDHEALRRSPAQRPHRRRRGRRLRRGAEGHRRPVRLQPAGPAERDLDSAHRRLHRGGAGGHRPVRGRQAARLRARRHHHDVGQPAAGADRRRRRPDPDPARAPQRARGAGHRQRRAGRLPGQHRASGAVDPGRAGLCDHRHRGGLPSAALVDKLRSLPETVRLRVVS